MQLDQIWEQLTEGSIRRRTQMSLGHKRQGREKGTMGGYVLVLDVVFERFGGELLFDFCRRRDASVCRLLGRVQHECI